MDSKLAWTHCLRFYVHPPLEIIFIVWTSTGLLLFSLIVTPEVPEALEFKDALVMLLVAAAPNLESISMYPLLGYSLFPSSKTHEGVNLLERLLSHASNFPESIPYCQNLRNISFRPDDALNEWNEYEEDPYYHRLNMIRKLSAVESVAFKLATWSNEAGIPPPPRSANYTNISFTHSAMNTWDLCRNPPRF
ncbi:hypothetical protein PENVUL_c049G04685 [Penicillium vulpinum]|uniref:Uncharacterized protein n=1 Tax=Penicillium vulpinum TaxID=29845 RepID=A0A1V6RGB2_9EURO|nr:hypothetical protein PENVUL_c049G04685 [Penicillium vulpinum]